jgi:putative transposase
MRRKHSPQLKAKAALEAMKGLRPVNEIAGELDVHPGLVTQWKKVATEGLPELFIKPDTQRAQHDDALTSRLYEEVGRLKVELDWLKKKSEQLR